MRFWLGYELRLRLGYELRFWLGYELRFWLGYELRFWLGYELRLRLGYELRFWLGYCHNIVLWQYSVRTAHKKDHNTKFREALAANNDMCKNILRYKFCFKSVSSLSQVCLKSVSSLTRLYYCHWNESWFFSTCGSMKSS